MTHTIHPGATIAPTARLDAAALTIGDGAVIGDHVVLRGSEIVIEAGARIDHHVTVDAARIRIGRNAVMEHGTQARAIGGRADEFTLGDCSFLGFEQNILVPILTLGDYTAIHNRCLISGYEPCTVGHNCWIGQDTILNATKRLTLGNGVRIGTGSRLWTHVASGELLEGCTMYGEWPLVLEDDVWIVGGGIVSPNLTVARGTVLMTGAVLTKSTEPRHVYAGVPARDVTDKLRVYQDVTSDDKRAMMLGFLHEFHTATANRWRDCVQCVETADAGRALQPDDCSARVVIQVHGECVDLGPRTSVFSLATKRYTKRGTELEECFIRFHVGYRARFVPWGAA